MISYRIIFLDYGKFTGLVELRSVLAGYMRRLVVSDILRGLRKRKVNNDEAAMNYKTVGLIGLCSGAGTTQLGIMLANYFSNGLHLKTAIVSSGFDDSLTELKKKSMWGKLRIMQEADEGFHIRG